LIANHCSLVKPQKVGSKNHDVLCHTIECSNFVSYTDGAIFSISDWFLKKWGNMVAHGEDGICTAFKVIVLKPFARESTGGGDELRGTLQEGSKQEIQSTMASALNVLHQSRTGSRRIRVTSAQ
jgi:hypothetical protein